MLILAKAGYNNSMDYVEIIERYVQQAWSEGKATREIKEELAQKRWPPEMVEVVIDRLVKKKVEKQSGKLPEINGPDFWHHPTWPIGESWAMLNRQRAQQNIDKNYSKLQKNIEEQDKNNKNIIEKKEPVAIPNPSPIASSEGKSPLPEPSTNAPVEKIEKKLPQKIPPHQVKKTTAQIVAELKSKHVSEESFTDRLQKKRDQANLDGAIQHQSLIFLGLLFLVIILAVIWRIFVIK